MRGAVNGLKDKASDQMEGDDNFNKATMALACFRTIHDGSTHDAVSKLNELLVAKAIVETVVVAKETYDRDVSVLQNEKLAEMAEQTKESTAKHIKEKQELQANADTKYQDAMTKIEKLEKEQKEQKESQMQQEAKLLAKQESLHDDFEK